MTSGITPRGTRYKVVVISIAYLTRWTERQQRQPVKPYRHLIVIVYRLPPRLESRGGEPLRFSLSRFPGSDMFLQRSP